MSDYCYIMLLSIKMMTADFFLHINSFSLKLWFLKNIIEKHFHSKHQFFNGVVIIEIRVLPPIHVWLPCPRDIHKPSFRSVVRPQFL